jgi:hypothetical protein
MLNRAISELNRAADVPKSKGKLCGGLLNKGDKGTLILNLAYKCYDCMT